MLLPRTQVFCLLSIPLPVPDLANIETKDQKKDSLNFNLELAFEHSSSNDLY
jgi:hypothetical protein